MEVTIDHNSGFCFGVVYAITMAEDELVKDEELYCLGDIVHNDTEVKRLNKLGLKIIDHDELKKLKNCKALIRAHGEPPETYELALKNNIELIDASCPVVLKLQNRIKNVYDDFHKDDIQIVIYGKPGHAEVNGLVGQTDKSAIIITSEKDLVKIDFSKPISLFSQTTKSSLGFKKIISMIESRVENKQPDTFTVNNTICHQVSKREPLLRDFASKFELVIFVCGKKSSNGQILYQVCKIQNPNTFLISDETEIDEKWFDGISTVGICGATSTPMWLMEKVRKHIISNIA